MKDTSGLRELEKLQGELKDLEMGRLSGLKEFLELSRELRPSQKVNTRRTLKKLLDVLIYEHLHNILPDMPGEDDLAFEENNKELMLKMFKEVMLDNQIFFDFWMKFNEESLPINSFVREFLDSFPYDAPSFLKVAGVLAGRNKYYFINELVALLSSLTKLTAEFKNFKYKRTEERDNQDIEMYQTLEDLEIQGRVRIPRGTCFHFSNEGKAVSFFGEWNFWAILWTNVTAVLNNFDSQKEMDFPFNEHKMIKFLCELISASPNILNNLEFQMVDLQNNRKGDLDQILEEKESVENPHLTTFNTNENLNETLLRALKGGDTDSREEQGGYITSMFLLDTLRICLDFEDNENTIIKLLEAIKSLLRSSHAHKMETVLHFYSCVCISKYNTGHPLIEVFSFLQGREKNLETWKIKEKKALQAKTCLVEIVDMMFQDDSVVFAQLRDPLQSAEDYSTNGLIEQVKKFDSIDDLSLSSTINHLVNKMLVIHDELLGESFWEVNCGSLAQCLNYLPIKNISLRSGLLESLVEHILVPVSDQVAFCQLSVSNLNIKFKYSMMRSLHRVLETLVQKLAVPQGSSQLVIAKSSDKHLSLEQFAMGNSAMDKIRKFVADLKIGTLLLECFKCNINIDSFKKSSNLVRTDGKTLLDNKHWVENVIQKKNEESRDHIRNYILSGVDLLASCIPVFSNWKGIHESNPLLDVYSIIGEKDNIHKYSFSHLNKTKSVNLLVCLSSLLEFDSEKGFAWIQNCQIPEMLRHVRVEVNPQFFSSEQQPGQLISNLKPSQLFNRAFDERINYTLPLKRSEIQKLDSFVSDDETNKDFLQSSLRQKLLNEEFYMAKAGLCVLSQSRPIHNESVQNAVLDLFAKLVRFWGFNSKLKKPELYDFMGGVFNDLPKAQNIYQR